MSGYVVSHVKCPFLLLERESGSLKAPALFPLVSGKIVNDSNAVQRFSPVACGSVCGFYFPYSGYDFFLCVCFQCKPLCMPFWVVYSVPQVYNSPPFIPARLYKAYRDLHSVQPLGFLYFNVL